MSHIPTPPDQENQTHISFTDPQFFDIYALSPETVLVYFSASSFYDRSCNNEIIRVRGGDASRELPQMQGIEYVIDHFVLDHELYVIVKQRRFSPDHVVPLASYYLMGRVFYQAPDLEAVLTSRMVKCLYSLHKVIEDLSGYVSFDPGATPPHTYNFKQKNTSQLEGSSSKDKEEEEEEEDATMIRQKEKTPEERQKLKENVARSGRILKSLFNKFPPPTSNFEQALNIPRKRPLESDGQNDPNKRARIG
eukprot:TRINITY_DN1401_c0_g1_i1.p2 TRINITY_DN1401_c0_g1~~TRINITY_DN1401_c0_g1_i1.p2  ORF type:complete len:250 (+),score=66.87 TRINITY_DN1401_c0_g1_i1:35-784(+)